MKYWTKSECFFLKSSHAASKYVFLPGLIASPNFIKFIVAGKLLGCESNTEDDLVKIVNKALYKKQAELKAHIADKELAILTNNESQNNLKLLIEN